MDVLQLGAVSMSELFTLLDHCVIEVDPSDPQHERKVALLTVIKDTVQHHAAQSLGFDVNDIVQSALAYENTFGDTFGDTFAEVVTH